MSRSQRLRLRDIRGVFRLIAEAGELGADACVWRTHVLRELGKTLDGTVGITLDLTNGFPGASPALIEPIDLGWRTVSERHLWLSYLSDGEARYDPAAAALFGALQSRAFLAAGRGQLVEDTAWYASPSVSEGRRYAGIDDFLCSAIRLAPGVLHGFILYRPWGAHPFEQRQRDLLRLFHCELLRTIRQQALQEQAAAFDLPPRLSQVLQLLQSGAAAKEIADQLGLRLHTVNSYVKQLYRRTGVAGKSELLARRIEHLRRRSIRLPEPLCQYAARPALAASHHLQQQ